MTSKTRALVLAVSIPVIAFAVIGGFLGQAMTRDDTFRHLAVFEDVVSIVLNNYVEEVDVTKAMTGAMHGLSEALDSDSAYLTPALVKSVTDNDNPGTAEVGLEVVRQYYLRVVSARDGSPAARAGLRPGDYIRAIDTRATRDMSAIEGMRLLRGAPGTKVSLLVIRGNAAEPHEIDLVRERLSAPALTSRTAAPGVGYIRVAEFTADSAQAIKQQIDRLSKAGASRFLIDLRGTARGDVDHGLAVARLFLKSGTLGVRQSKNDQREIVAAQANDGSITMPLVLLTNVGTSGAAEVLAAALDGNDRATLIGERTLGRAARQRLVKLPDGSGLWLSYLRYMTPKGEQLHQKGLMPDVAVDEPDIEFGSVPLTTDPVFERALEHLSVKKAA